MPNQEYLNENLYIAISVTALSDIPKAISEMTGLIDEGANPTDTIKLGSKSGDILTTTPLCTALQLDNFELLFTMISKCNEKGIKIKLDDPYQYGKNKSIKKNIFQHACVNNSQRIVNLLIKHGIQTGQNMFAICNNEIIIKPTSGDMRVACIGDLMNLTINALSISASHALVGEEYNSKEFASIIANLNEWRNLAKNLNPSAKVPELPETIKIYANGRYDVLELLIKNKLLDPEVTTLTMHAFHQTLKQLTSYESVDDFVDEVVNKINAFSGTKLTKEDVSTNPATPGVFVLQMNIFNTTRENEQKFEVTFDLREAAELVEKYAAEVKAGSLIRLDSFRRLQQQAQKTSDTVAALPSVRLDEFRRELSDNATAISCLNAVQIKTKGALNAYMISATGKMDTKSTSTKAQVLRMMQSAFQAIAQGSNVPGATILPAISKWVLESSLKAEEHKKSEGVINVIANIDADALAVGIAGFIATLVRDYGCDSQNGKLANQIATHVVEQIDKLKTFSADTFENLDQVIAFLAIPAIQKIQATARSDSDEVQSKDSMASFSGSDRSIDQTNLKGKRRPSKGGGCVVS